MPFLSLTKHLSQKKYISVCCINEFRLYSSSHDCTQAIQHVCYFIQSVYICLGLFHLQGMFKVLLTHWLLDILVVFKLDFGQISFTLVHKTFATQQFAFLATSIPFYDISARACAEIKSLKVTYVFRLFNFCFFSFSFFPFLFFLLQWLAFYWACLKLKKTF